MTDENLRQAVATIVETCLAVRAGENVAVVTDPEKLALAQVIVEHARQVGADAVLLEMSERPSNGTEPAQMVAAAMLAADVVIAPTSKSISHTAARHKASERGARIATLPGATEDMVSRMLAADYDAIADRCKRVAAVLTEGEEVHITTAAGTDVTLSISGRSGISDDGDLGRPGAFGNLPAGEAFIAPVEGRTNGRIVFDGSIWPIGLLERPLVVEIENGYATELSGPRAAEFRSLLEPFGRDAFAVAELGIGTHDGARLGGNVLEDEKILGTVHVAFGDNHSFGGNVRVASHQDGIVLSPTVRVDGRVLIEGGELRV